MVLRNALAGVFPNGPSPAAALLIERMTYKALKMAMFEASDLQGAQVSDKAVGLYITLSNSFRMDLQVLQAMAGQTSPPDDPDLREYLDTIRKAAKAEVIRVPRTPAKPKGGAE